MTDSMNPLDDRERGLAEYADRLLAGDVIVGELPDDVSALAGFLSTIRTETEPEDSLADAQMVASIAARIRSKASHERTRRSVRVLGRRVRLKAASVALVAVLATGTAAAAATGSLPDPVQKVVSRALSHFHISVPDPDPLVTVPASAHNTESTPRESPTPAGLASSRHGTEVDDSPTSTIRRAHSGSAPTSTSQPKVPPASLAPSDSPPTTNAGGNANAYGRANGNANPNGIANGIGNGNGNGKAPGAANGTGPGNGKGKASGKGKGNGNSTAPGTGSRADKVTGKPTV